MRHWGKEKKMAKANMKQVEKVGEFLKDLQGIDGTSFNFYDFEKDGKRVYISDAYPPLNHPQAINFFFYAVSQDFGFWYGDHEGYHSPIYGNVNKKEWKGADLQWRVLKTAFDNDEASFEPGRFVFIHPLILSVDYFSADAGPILFPDLGVRFRLTTAFGQWFEKENTTPAEIVSRANDTNTPLEHFLNYTRRIPGYDTDHLQKKNLLLAMVLANRPERFLKVTDPGHWLPIIDYHLMRLALRQGMVDLDKEDREVVSGKLWCGEKLHESIRLETYFAFIRLLQVSKREHAFLDKTYWMGRKYCPEQGEIRCGECIFDPVCKKRTDLFQPVFRTTFY